MRVCCYIAFDRSNKYNTQPITLPHCLSINNHTVTLLIRQSFNIHNSGVGISTFDK